MKYSLYMIMCSLLAGECMAPFQIDETFDSMYSCLNAGYQESLNKSIEIGKEDVDQYQIYIKFICKAEEEIILPKGDPV